MNNENRLENLVHPKEKLLFKILFCFSILVWLGYTAISFGILLIIAFFAWICMLFFQSAFICHLKGNAAKVGPQQFPEIHQKVLKACQKLGMDTPDTYVWNGDGMMNAFATKFLRKEFIILNSDIVDAFERNDLALDFYIGHELGHLHRKHLRYFYLLAPSMLFPIIYPSYRRACEYTCDQYGKYCADGSIEHSLKGAAALVVGKDLRKRFSTEAFIAQSKENNGFWMSLQELTSTYP